MMMTAGTPKTKLLPSHHHQHISTRFFTGWMPFLGPTNSIKAAKADYRRK